MPAGPNPYYRAPRSVMSRNELAIDWQHLLGLRKAARDAARPMTGTARGQGAPERVFDAGEAMPEEAMYAMLADGDPRPLLVLRECKSCEGLEDPLLVRDGNNERVMLMSRWFRCVRVGYEVVDEKHVLRGLFPGKEPGYVFVSHADGSARIDLPRDASTSKITGAMKKTLASRYRGRPDRALKALFRILDEYDDLDVRLRELNQAHGPGGRRGGNRQNTASWGRSTRSCSTATPSSRPSPPRCPRSSSSRPGSLETRCRHRGPLGTRAEPRPPVRARRPRAFSRTRNRAFRPGPCPQPGPAFY